MGATEHISKQFEADLDTTRTRVTRCTLTTPRSPVLLTHGPERAEAAAMLGLTNSNVVGDCEVWSCGVPYLVVPVDLEALSRAELGIPRWRALLSGAATDPVYPVAPAGENTWRVRMFAPGHGVAEDPACACVIERRRTGKVCHPVGDDALRLHLGIEA